MINPDIKKAILAGVEAKALYLGNTLVWLRKVDIVLDTEEVTVEVATDDTKHQFVAKTFTTSPAGYEQNVSITVGGEPYVKDMLLPIGNYTVTYTLADSPNYFGDTKSYSLVVKKKEEEPVTIPVSIVVDTDPITVHYPYDADYYTYMVKDFVTNPTGYESNVVIKIGDETYTSGMRLVTGTYTVSYTLADGEGYTGDTKSYTLVVMQDEEPAPEPVPEGFEVDISALAGDNSTKMYWKGNGDRLNPPGPESAEDKAKDPNIYDWSWWRSIAEAQTSMHTKDCLQIEERSETTGGTAVPSLCVYIKNEPSSSSSGQQFNAKTCLVYSRKMFPRGRIDIRANMMEDVNQKNTIWALSTTMNRTLNRVVVDPLNHTFTAGPERTIKYSYEFDVVEYTPANAGEGTYGTNRAMWCWQQNKQSLLHGSTNPWARIEILKDSEGNPIRTSDDKLQGWVDTFFTNKGTEADIDPLPWLFLDEHGEPHCLSAGMWYPHATTGYWYLSHHYNICYDGNKVKGIYKNGSSNGCYYFLKSYVVEDAKGYPNIVRNTYNSGVDLANRIHTSDLHWIKYDPVNKTLTEGSGLDTGLHHYMAPGDIDEAGKINPHSIGLGRNVTGNIKGTDIVTGDWHTWSLEVTEDRVKYLCDDYAYVDKGHDNLTPLTPTEDYACGLVFSTVYPREIAAKGKEPVTDCMVVSRISFTPEDTSQGTIQTGE